MRKKLNKSKGNDYVTAAIIIVIVIVVGLIFKEQITKFLSDFFVKLTEMANTSFF